MNPLMFIPKNDHQDLRRLRSHFFFTRSTDYERDSDKLHQHTMSLDHPLQGKWVANYKRAGMVLLDNNHPGKGKRKLLATAQRERHKVQSNYLRWITSLLAYLRPSNQPTNVATAATQGWQRRQPPDYLPFAPLQTSDDAMVKWCGSPNGFLRNTSTSSSDGDSS